MASSCGFGSPQNHSCGRPATPVLSRSPQRNDDPLRGVAQTRYDSDGRLRVVLDIAAHLAGALRGVQAGYEVQRLAAQRDELRRQNALLEVESARLDSPARIEADAARLGLVRAAAIRVVAPEAVAAHR